MATWAIHDIETLLLPGERLKLPMLGLAEVDCNAFS